MPPVLIEEKSLRCINWPKSSLGTGLQIDLAASGRVWDVHRRQTSSAVACPGRPSSVPGRHY